MYKFVSSYTRFLKARIFLLPIIKYRLLNILIILVMLISSSASLETKAAPGTTDTYQVCDWTDPVFINWKEVECRLLPEVTDSSGMNEQETFAPEASSTLESLSSIPTVPWNVQVGSVGTEINDIATDTSANVYVTGTIASTNDSDAFVAKLDSIGNVMWSYSFAGMSYDEGWGIALDVNEDIFITGSARNSSNPDTNDILLARLSNDGVLQWKTTWGNTTQQDSGRDIALDGTGNIYVTGGSFGSWGSPIRPHTSGQYDAFAAKFDPNSGNRIWNTFLGENLNGFGIGIATDSTGNVYITGVNFIPNSPSDAFVAGLNTNGSLLWYTTVGSAASNDSGRDVAFDADGNIYVVGQSWGSWGSPLNAFSGPQDAFILKLGNGGGLQWHTFIGGTDWDMGYGIDLDTAGNIYIAGNSTTTWGNPFDSGTGTPQEVFAAKLDNNGSLLWNTFIKGEAWYQSYGHKNRIAVQDGSIYIVSNVGAFDTANAYITKIIDSPYDCSGTTLSPIAQAVLAEVENQNYCLNKFEKFTFIENGTTGLAAFEEFAELASQADYEVDFTTMIWDKMAGEIFLDGVEELYEKVSLNPSDYPSGVQVRILLGAEHYLLPDQRQTVLQSLSNMGVPLENRGLLWKIEVASFRNSHSGIGYAPPNTHSHVKILIVDGEVAIVGGYNLQTLYINPLPFLNLNDVGIKISGPVVQDSLIMFDELWQNGRGLSCDIQFFCEYTTEPLDHAPEVLFIQPVTSNQVNVFSLFRDNSIKTADTAITEAIRAASDNVNLLQNRFFENYPPDEGIYYPDSFPYPPGEQGPFPYTQAIVDATQNGTQFQLLLSSGDKKSNAAGVNNLREYILLQPNGATAYNNIHIRFTKDPTHTKALSLDGQFVVVGSQNFDFSAFGNDPDNIMDLAEYSFGVDSPVAASVFDNKFTALWNVAHEFTIVDNSIQEAIDQASPGTIIYIPAGVYQESLTINKPLTLLGQSVSSTILENEEPVLITSSGVTVTNLSIRGGVTYGMKLQDVSLNSLKDILISNVVFDNNVLGGILVEGLIPGSPIQYTIENNTFIGGQDGITLNLLETQLDTSFIRNNIFIGQSSAPIHILSASDGQVEYSYNLYSLCGSSNDCTTSWYIGDLATSSNVHDNFFNLDPQFVDPALADYRLSLPSPLIDSGDPNTVSELIFDGDGDGTIQIDIGAFEYVPVANVAPVVTAGNDQTVELGNAVTVNATYTDADNSESHSARIDWGDGITEDVPVTMTGPGAGEVTGQHTYADTGSYTVEVCVTDLYGGVGCDTSTIVVSPLSCTPSNSYGQSQSNHYFASFKPASSLTNFDRLPLSFVPNMGQEDAAVKFQAQGLGGRLFFTPSEVVFSLPNPVKIKEDDKEKIRYDLHPANVVRIHYQGANDNPEIAGIGKLPGVVNVLKGNNPSKWRTNLPTYAGIAYRELYAGIELRYEGTDGKLKSTFHVAPGADPSSIIWRYKGASDVSIDESGNLVVSLPEPAGNGAVLIEQAPVSWQEVNGNRVMVAVQYALDKKDKKVSFLLPNGYDSTLPLVIDPELTYSAYLGGGKGDEGNAITLDADCNAYLTGVTASLDFPTVNPLQTNQPSSDVFVSKLNPTGDTLLYSTYIGGGGSDHAWGIGLDSAGRITIIGETESSNFPTLNAYDNSYATGTCEGGPCDDVFVTQLSADGSNLRYSTYLGGSGDDEAMAMALGPDGMVYLTGGSKSSTFPMVNAYDNTFGGGTCDGYPCEDVFVAKVDPAGVGAGSLLYSTFLGGSNYDKGRGIAVDASGRVYVSGYTRSDSFPTLNPYQLTRAGGSDAFIAKLDTALSGSASLLYGTYLGGNQGDRAYGIALNGADQVYITGYTDSPDFPLQNAFDNLLNGVCGSDFCLDAFVTHLDIANNNLVYSSFLGGSGEDNPASITVDNLGNAYITGYTESTDFPVINAIQPTKGADSCSSPPCADAFVTKVNPAGNTIVYSTYLGGTGEDYGNAIVVDGLGGAYIIGQTFSSDFPITSDLSVGSNSYSDAFVVKIDD